MVVWYYNYRKRKKEVNKNDINSNYIINNCTFILNHWKGGYAISRKILLKMIDKFIGKGYTIIRVEKKGY